MDIRDSDNALVVISYEVTVETAPSLSLDERNGVRNRFREFLEEYFEGEVTDSQSSTREVVSSIGKLKGFQVKVSERMGDDLEVVRVRMWFINEDLQGDITLWE